MCKDLAYRFKISTAMVSRIFNSWILFIDKYLKTIIRMPPLDVLRKNTPECLKNFADTRVVLDCTEVFIQIPFSLENKSLTYSHCKSHNTFKSLLVNTTGAVVYLSDLYECSVSDIELVLSPEF